MSETVERWSSRRAFILAVTGAAVGLGNIWRFPYITGENGGAAFLLLYIFFVALLGVPVMMAEIMIGRAGRRSPMMALSHLARQAGATPHWRWVGLFGAITVFFILSFYSVVSGWSIEYLISAVNGSFASRSPAEIGTSFDTFLADPLRMTFNHTLFMLLTMSVVAAGVSGGLEKLNNLLMPLLYIILLILAIYATTTEGFGQAITWLFTPDPGAITVSVVLSAMGHAFFTLAVGACALMAYGAYMPDHQSLTRAAVSVVVLNVAVAILAGIAVFSVVFTQGMDPAEGPGLMFVTLPIAFSELPGGAFWLGGFFLLLLLAAWTSSINLAEPMVSMLRDAGLKRGHAAAVIGILVWAVGLLSVLSFSSMADVHWFGGKTFFDWVTSVPPAIFLPMGGVMIATFAAWVMPREMAIRAMDASPRGFRLWQGLVRYVSIPLMVVVLLSGLL